MKQHSQISGAEFEVMQILWEADEPLNIQTVCDRLPSNKWAYKTVGTLLMRMEEKGAVSSEKRGHSCRDEPSRIARPGAHAPGPLRPPRTGRAA